MTILIGLCWIPVSAIAAPKQGSGTPGKVPAGGLNNIPGSGIPGSQIDPQQAAQIEEMMRMRALQSRRGRGGVAKTGEPIILNGGAPALAPPISGGDQNNTSTRKSSKERRAEAKQAAAERKRLKKEQAEKAKAEKKVAKDRPAKAAKKVEGPGR
jgi:hypothetical protein